MLRVGTAFLFVTTCLSYIARVYHFKQISTCHVFVLLKNQSLSDELNTDKGHMSSASVSIIFVRHTSKVNRPCHVIGLLNSINTDKPHSEIHYISTRRKTLKGFVV